MEMEYSNRLSSKQRLMGSENSRRLMSSMGQQHSIALSELFANNIIDSPPKINNTIGVQRRSEFVKSRPDKLLISKEYRPDGAID